MPPARALLRRHGWPWLVLALGCGLHAVVAWSLLGGWADLTSEWPLLRSDHAIHYTLAVAGRDLIRGTGFLGGYDPRFMAGYPLSVAASSFTLAPAAMALCGDANPAVVYKWTVLATVVAAPILLVAAGLLLGIEPRGVAWALVFYLIYFWTDFPWAYTTLGMVAFLLSVPAGLVATAALVGYVGRGGLPRWAAAAAACAAAFFVHLSCPMVVGFAGLAAYAHATVRARRGLQAFPPARHLGFWALAGAILAVNASWLLPGYWLRSATGDTALTFFHPEPLLPRLGAIFWNEGLAQPLLIGLGLVGLVVLGPIRPLATTALAGFALAGLGWGYLAGPFRSLDGLQPGRQTLALYTGLCLAAGAGLGEVADRVRAARPGRIDLWLTLAFAMFVTRLFGPYAVQLARRDVLGAAPALSSRPSPALVRLVAALRRHVEPGSRLFYEETGWQIPGLTDPFGDRHLSAALPALAGVEVIGGPYLHTLVRANFAQFGEGKLFGLKDWGRDQFVRYARLYRPAAIACWTPGARAFCRNNPDLVRVLDDGPDLLLGRVLGFEGAAIRGRARVEAGVNRLVVRDLEPDADGLIVLRYHTAPCLVADPPVPIEPVALEADPVPFIGLRPPAGHAGPVTIRMALPPREGWLSRPADGGTP